MAAPPGGLTAEHLALNLPQGDACSAVPLSDRADALWRKAARPPQDTAMTPFSWDASDPCACCRATAKIPLPVFRISA